MYDLEEQEQIDALKAWWRQHGRLLIVAAVAAIAAAGAVSGWRYYKDSQAAKASQLYATLEKAVRANDVKQVKEVAGQLIDRYGGTAYGPMAALAAAKADFDAGDLASAARAAGMGSRAWPRRGGPRHRAAAAGWCAAGREEIR